MKKRNNYLVSFVVLLLLAVISGVYLYARLDRGVSSAVEKNEFVQRAKNDPVDRYGSIVKEYRESVWGAGDEKKSTLVYEIKGVLVGDMEMRSDKLLKGKFYIEGDENKREVGFLAGSFKGEEMVFGEITFSKENLRNSSWKYTPSALVMELVGDGDGVYLESSFDAELIGGDGLQSALVLDELRKDVRSKAFEYEIPEGFSIGVHRFGVILEESR